MNSKSYWSVLAPHINDFIDLKKTLGYKYTEEARLLYAFDRFLLDQRRARMDMPSTKEAVKTMSERWPKAGAKLVEDKANGPAVIQELRHEVAGLIEVNPEGGKVALSQGCGCL